MKKAHEDREEKDFERKTEGKAQQNPRQVNDEVTHSGQHLSSDIPEHTPS
jgi:hypothetical protein